jgi:ABC-type molybdate transport system substrate-binding protein
MARCARGPEVARRARWLLALALMLAGAASARAEDIVLFGAGSLREAMTALADDYRRAHKVTIRTEFGPSGLLRERIEQGAKADLLASADLGHPLKLQQQGLADQVVLFARNAVCAFAPATSGLSTDTLVARLSAPGFRIGVAAAKADPLGDYTEEIFRRAEAARAGGTAALHANARVVTGAALPPASSGGAPPAEDPVAVQLREHQIDVYLGYCSGGERLMRAVPGLQAIALPATLRVGPEYGIARLKGASAAASDFLLAILSVEGQRTLARHGFVPVAAPES